MICKRKKKSLFFNIIFLAILWSPIISSALPAPSLPQHLFSLKLSNTSSLALPSKVAVTGASHLLYPFISPSVHEIPLQVLLIFSLIVLHFSSGNHHHMLALLPFSFPKWHLLLAVVPTNIFG